MNERGSSPILPQGYVTDASYAETFFRELSPAWLNYVAALNGGLPRALDAPFRYLELGCGFGGSTNVNAGAFPAAEFHGCDLNPAHVAGARRHAAALALANVEFHERSFYDLARADLPPFDFIVLHGVYSWVDAAARAAVRAIIRDRLVPGGLVYVSYNCVPGWAVEIPLRKLLVELAAAIPGDAEARAQRALLHLQQLAAGKLRYFMANPGVGAALDSYARQPAAYLPHEFLNEAWEPFYSVDVADEMAAAGVTYLGSATLADNHPTLVLDAGAAQALASLPGARQQQLALDFAVNRRFRRDVFVRDERRLDEAAAQRVLGSVPIGCVTDPRTLTTTVRVPRGELRLQEDFIDDLKDVLRAGSMPIAGVAAALAGGRRGTGDITRNLTYLLAGGALMPFARACLGSPSSPHPHDVAPILERVLSLVRSGRAAHAVPSEVLGNGVTIEPAAADALTEWLASGTVATPPPAAGALPQTLRRLGLLS